MLRRQKGKLQISALNELTVGLTVMFFLQLKKLKLEADVNSKASASHTHIQKVNKHAGA